MYIEPFSKIKVVSSITSKCKVGSLGYMGFCDKLSDDFNLWSAYVVFTRLGKRGKPTLKAMEINIPIIDPDKVYSEPERAILNKIKVFENLETEPPTKIPRRHVCRPEVQLEIINPDFKDLISAPVHDYLAFVCILSSADLRFERKYVGGFIPNGRMKHTEVEMQRIANMVAHPETSHIASTILQSIHMGGELESELLKVFDSTKGLRLKIIETLWKRVAAVADWIHLYRETKLIQTASMLRYINELISEWSLRPEELAKIENDPLNAHTMGVLRDYSPMSEWALLTDKQNESQLMVVREGRHYIVGTVGGAVTRRTNINRPVPAPSRGRQPKRPNQLTVAPNTIIGGFTTVDSRITTVASNEGLVLERIVEPSPEQPEQPLLTLLNNDSSVQFVVNLNYREFVPHKNASTDLHLLNANSILNAPREKRTVAVQAEPVRGDTAEFAEAHSWNETAWDDELSVDPEEDDGYDGLI